jgi:hypothetical protein
MRRLEPGRGRAIEEFDGAEAWVRGVSRRVLQVVLIEVGSGGVVGRHPTGGHQVFAVLRLRSGQRAGTAPERRSREATS